MVGITNTIDRDVPASDLSEAGAPDEIKVTPFMIRAGLNYLEETGINSLTSKTTYPAFVEDFIRAIFRPQPSRPSREDVC